MTILCDSKTSRDLPAVRQKEPNNNSVQNSMDDDLQHGFYFQEISLSQKINVVNASIMGLKHYRILEGTACFGFIYYVWINIS